MVFGSGTLRQPRLGSLYPQRRVRWTPRRRHDAQPPPQPWTRHSLLQLIPRPHLIGFTTTVSSTCNLIRADHVPVGRRQVSGQIAVLPRRCVWTSGTRSKGESRLLELVVRIAVRVHREGRLTGRLTGLAHHDPLHDLAETSLDRRITP